MRYGRSLRTLRLACDPPGALASTPHTLLRDTVLLERFAIKPMHQNFVLFCGLDILCHSLCLRVEVEGGVASGTRFKQNGGESKIVERSKQPSLDWVMPRIGNAVFGQ